MTPLEGALECAKRGWYVFRLIITHDPRKCNGGTTSCKIVTTPNHEKWSDVSSNDPGVIASWDWDDVNAYGIDCGKSGLLVVDRDPAATWPFGDGTRVHGTGRGEHYVYEDILGGVTIAAKVPPWGVDVRAEGGMVIGPGSWHPHGAYEVLVDVDPAPAPIEIVEALRRQPRAATEVVGGDLDQLEVLPRLEGAYARLAAAEPGEINDTLYRMTVSAAGLWARLPEEQRCGVFDEEAIREKLEELTASIPHPFDEGLTRATVERGWEWGAAHPMPDDAQVDLYGSTPLLAHIRLAAHSRGLDAPLVLAYVLAYVLMEIPPGWVLPPTVATAASLNLGFAVVGVSSAGKSASAYVASEVLGIDPGPYTRPIGSGEGMIDQFLDYKNKINGEPQLSADPRRLFSADEVESLNRLVERNGATLSGFLKSALTGGQLGTANAAAGGRLRNLPARVYRLSLVVGVQPALSGVLIGGENSGLPQRFLWMDARDPDAPRVVDDIPPWPGVLEWSTPTEALFVEDREIWYPESVRREVIQARLDERNREDGDVSEGHLNLTRLKVAMALAFLHGEKDISHRWWGLAGRFVRRSAGVVDWCKVELGKAAEQERQKRAREAGEDAMVTQAVIDVHGEAVTGAIRAITRVTREAGEEGVQWSKCRRVMSKKQQGVAEVARAKMVAQGLVDVEETPTGPRGGRPGERVVWIE